VVNVELAQRPKDSTSTETYMQLYRELAMSTVTTLKLYTDGSKTEAGVGYAITTQRAALVQKQLEINTSVYTAELTAVLNAVQIAKGHTKVTKIVECGQGHKQH
jgi:hypothetical protein